jgi:hypothetical protein
VRVTLGPELKDHLEEVAQALAGRVAIADPVLSR